MSSSNAVIAALERGEYPMSKAAVAMMAKLFAVRLLRGGSAVYEVRPMSARRRDRGGGRMTVHSRRGSPRAMAHAYPLIILGALT
jgi:NAD(P)-dependent dehydrogenase (short-subunit alcohol dehydrogenase family)